MYKGYTVNEEVINDYQHPETAIVLDAPCGCYACDEQVQPGHFACSLSPQELTSDENVSRRLDNNRWFWTYHGPPEHVDGKLEIDDEFDVVAWYAQLDRHWPTT